MTKSALRHTANRVYSYATLIRQTLANGLTIGNITYYSRTTARHQVLAECDTCDILLGNVPKGCDDLLQLAIDRGKVQVNQWRTDTMPAPAFTYIPAPANKAELLELEGKHRSQRYYHWLADGMHGPPPHTP